MFKVNLGKNKAQNQFNRNSYIHRLACALFHYLLACIFITTVAAEALKTLIFQEVNTGSVIFKAFVLDSIYYVSQFYWILFFMNLYSEIELLPRNNIYHLEPKSKHFRLLLFIEIAHPCLSTVYRELRACKANTDFY